MEESIRPVERILRPFEAFFRLEASGGILLLACTALALAWANSPWAEGYHALWHTPLSVSAGPFALSMDLLHWINDGLMVLFFLLVGLEIKREILVGELASPAKAALPLVAAAGGMVVPAALYVAFNLGSPGEAGWGIPMATDIAFALGILALLGPRVPTAAKIFLTALAIVDDIGAILVIALFYSADISAAALAGGFLALAVLVVANRLHVRSPLVYLGVGLVVWLAFVKSGVHATVAGVLLAFTVPARSHLQPRAFVERCRHILDRFQSAGPEDDPVLRNEGRLAAVYALEHAGERAQTPLQRLEHGLHPWITYGVIPLFALANAGVTVVGGFELAAPAVLLGTGLGLVVGKPVGVVVFSLLAVRVGLARLPQGMGLRQLLGLGLLAGVGFTMSLFIGALAFADPALLATAKVGVLAASTTAGIAGYLVLRTRPPA